MKRGAVITGVGCVTPIGIGFEEFSRALQLGRSGVGPIALFDATTSACKVAAEVDRFDPLAFMDLREARALPRVVQFAVAAAKLAVRDAYLVVERPERVAIVAGTSSGPLAYALEQHAIYLERGVRRTHPSLPAYAHNSVLASECAIQLGIRGPVLAVSSACTSGADAIGLGQMMIESGAVDIVLAGGADAPIIQSLLASFERLGLVSTHFNDCPGNAARPFSEDRDGLVIGEGAAMLVVEAEEHAAARGARTRARLLGYGATCDAGSHFRQEPSGRDAIRAIEIALSAAGMSASSLDYVNAHGTGTRDNDPFEAMVLQRVLGERALDVPVSSSKSQFGHLLGASGAVEAAAVVAAIEGRFAPATLNLERVASDCELSHVRDVRPLDVDAALSVSFGFGSRNAALVLGRAL